MSTLLGKENPNHASAFIEHVGTNSNASSISSAADDFDDDHSSSINVTTPSSFKAANSIAAAAAAATATAATSSILTNLSRLNAAHHHHHHHHLSTSSTSSHPYRSSGSGSSGSSKDMGGFSIPHHSLSAAFYGYHTSQMSNDCLPNIPSSSSSGSIATAFSSAQHGHHHHHHYSSSTTSSNGATNQHANATISASSHTPPANSSTNKPSPFLLPAQLYKSLFANAVLHNPDKIGCSPHPFPRNLLFSYSDRSPNSPDNFDNDEKPTISTEVRNVRGRSFDWMYFDFIFTNKLFSQQTEWHQPKRMKIELKFQILIIPIGSWDLSLKFSFYYVSNWILTIFLWLFFISPKYRNQQLQHHFRGRHRRIVWTVWITIAPKRTIITVVQWIVAVII